MIPAPDPVLCDIRNRLEDRLTPVTDLESARWKKELQQRLRKASSAVAEDLHYLLGRLAYRRTRFNDAAHHFKVAAGVSSGPRRTEHLGRHGAVLLRLGQAQEALPHLEAVVRLAARQPASGAAAPRNAVINRGNVAEAHSMLGNQGEALRWFREALEVAGYDHPADLCHLASSAAVLGLNGEAVELLARAISLRNGTPLDGPALSFIREHAEAVADLAGEDEDLTRVVRQELRFRGALSRLGWRPAARGKGDGGEEALRVFEAMRPLRQRANAAVLGGAVEDEV